MHVRAASIIYFCTLSLFYLKDSVYQSLRRQMNMYGFHLTDNAAITKNLRHSNWWCRDGGYFCRDNPQLQKIRPRRRPERSTSIVIAPTISQRPAEKRAIKTVNKDVKETSSRPSSSTQTGKRRVQLYVKGNPSFTGKIAELNRKYPPTRENQPTADPAVAVKASDLSNETSNASVKVPATSTKSDEDFFDHPNTKYDIFGDNTRKRFSATLSQSFPKLLHEFISDCAISNPDIVQWNTNHTAFNVEIHHPELPALLLKYFQRTIYIFGLC
jgi:hypothetical protein